MIFVLNPIILILNPILIIPVHKLGALSDLLLNQPIQGFQGYPLLNIETNEELLVPIFTIWETMIIEWAIIPLRPLAFSNNLDYVYMNLRCMKI